MTDDDRLRLGRGFLLEAFVRGLATAAFDLAVEPRGVRLDALVPDALVQHVPVERCLELGAVEFLSHVKVG